jgi:hypothetical protein
LKHLRATFWPLILDRVYGVSDEGGCVPKPRLTKRQRQLIVEVKHLLSKFDSDPDEIAAMHSSKDRTTYLELAKSKIIRSVVILTGTAIDEHLSFVICFHFFGKRKSIQQLWKTKRFRTFNYFILERLYLLQKLDLVKSIHDIPKWVASDIAALNELRNSLSHSFFPENRRRKPEWKGQSIFATDGYDRFWDDMKKLANFFVERFWNG